MTFLFLALFSVTGFAAKTVEVYITNKAAPRLNSEAYLIPQNILVGSKLNIEILMTEVYTFTVNDDVEEIRSGVSITAYCVRCVPPCNRSRSSASRHGRSPRKQNHLLPEPKYLPPNLCSYL